MTSTSGPRRYTTRHRIYESAVSLIAEQGLSATTVEEIADRAGVAKGTVYYNYAGKAELFDAVLRHSTGLLSASLQRAADASATRQDRTLDALDSISEAALAFVERNPDAARLYLAELWRASRAWQPALTSVRHQVVAVVEEVLRHGVKRGDLNDAVDVQLTAAALVGLVLVSALDWRTYQQERSVADVHAAVSLLIRGQLGADGRP